MPRTENFKRVIVAVLAVPLILIASYLGGYYFLFFTASISLFSFYEFVLLAKNKNANVNFILGGLVILALLLNQYRKFIDVEAIIILSSLVLLIAELFRNNGSAIYNLGSTFLGIYYIGIFSSSLIF